MRMAYPKVTSFGLLSVAACLLVLAAIGSGIAALFQFVSNADNTDGVGLRLDDQIKNAHKIYSADVIIPFAKIIVSVQDVDPKERTVSATVEARFYDGSPSGGFPTLVDTKGNVIYPEDPRFVRSSLTLTLYCFPSGEAVASFPLSGIDQSPGLSAKIDIPVEGSPQSFPHDRYDLDIIYATLTTPEGTRLRYQYKTAKGERVGSTNSWPIGLGIAWGDRLVDWRMKSSLATSVSRQSYGAYGVDVSSQLKRPISLILFVYSITLAPALLGLSYWLRARRKESREDSMSPLELGAAFIALLALRQVLIPSGIPGITLLDRFLGIEIVALVAVAVAGLSHRSHPLNASALSHEQPEATSTSARHSVVAVLIFFVVMLWRWFKRLSR